jgi:NAD(P)-dependent dehydrogenase (short-subunit alcohol dehydrogenase family)
MTTNDQSARTVLITGAARGIGAELARQLADHGFEVWVAARDLEAAGQHASSLQAAGYSAHGIRLDLDDPGSIATAAASLGQRPLDLLVNNAARFADWTEMPTTADLATARAVLDTNLFGTWATIQAFLPALRNATSGRIVNVGSGGGSHGDTAFGLAAHPSAVSYAVSKAALHALTVKMSVELAPEGITVVAADPGLTATAPGMEEMGARPISEGARSIVTAALADDTGTFTRDGQPLLW